MKRFLSVILASVLLSSLSACGGGASPEAAVSLPTVSDERALLEYAGAVATQQYLVARLKTEALAEFDMGTGDIGELAMLVDEAMVAWQVAELASAGARDLVADAERSRESSGSAEADGAFSSASASVEVAALRIVQRRADQASDQDAALRWAEDLTAKYDSYPAGEQVRSLAESLGTDAKTAYTQLQVAQEIIKSDAYGKEGDWAARIEKTLMAVKTASKTGLYVGGVVASGGVATGVLEAGGMVIGGVDTIVDIAATGSTIILGEHNMVSIAANDLKEIVEPVASAASWMNVVGGGPLKFSGDITDKLESLDKLTFIGENVVDLVNGGKILGGAITVSGDGEASIEMSQVSTEGKAHDEVAKGLTDAGLPVPEEQGPATITERAEEYADEYALTEDELTEIIDALRDLLYEMFLDDKPGDEPSDRPTDLPTAGLPIDAIVGTYEGRIFSESGEDSGTWTFTSNDDGELVDSKGNVWQYAPSTGIATVSSTHGEISATMTVVFVVHDNQVTMSGVWTVTDTETGRTEDLQMEGTKVG